MSISPRLHPELEPLDPPADPWEPLGRGAILLPQTAGTDAMFLLRLELRNEVASGSGLTRGATR